MKRNKIISILEYSARNKMLVGILAVSLIGAGGVFLSSHATFSNNTIGINKIVLAGTLNNDGNKGCVINGNDSLVLYTSASNSDIQSYTSVGEMLTINSYSNGYYNVTVQETGATGYIASSNMQKIVSGVEDNLTSLSGTGYITNVSTMVNLREEATMNSTSLVKLKNDTSLTLLGKQGDWYKVEVNGTTGYIYGEYIAIANASSNTTASNSPSSSSSGTSSMTSKTTGATSNSNSSSSTTKTTSANNSSSTTKATVKSTSNTSGQTSSTGSSTTKSEYSPYFGSWTVNTNPVAEIYGVGGKNPTKLPETIFLSESKFVFGNTVINNPHYKIETVSSTDFTGNGSCESLFGNGEKVQVLLVSSSSNANIYNDDASIFVIHNGKLDVPDGVCFYEYSLTNSSTTSIDGSTGEVSVYNPVVKQTKLANEKLPANLSIINVASGQCYYTLSEYANKLGINSNTLRKEVYNQIKGLIQNNGYIVLNSAEQEIVEHGTTAQKEALMNKYGKDALLINVTDNTNFPATQGETVYPGYFTDGQFYYSFAVATLQQMCENSNSFGEYNGVISTDGQLANVNTFNEACKNKEVYSLNVEFPAWLSFQMNL